MCGQIRWKAIGWVLRSDPERPVSCGARPRTRYPLDMTALLMASTSSLLRWATPCLLRPRHHPLAQLYRRRSPDPRRSQGQRRLYQLLPPPPRTLHLARTGRHRPQRPWWRHPSPLLQRSLRSSHLSRSGAPLGRRPKPPTRVLRPPSMQEGQRRSADAAQGLPRYRAATEPSTNSRSTRSPLPPHSPGTKSTVDIDEAAGIVVTETAATNTGTITQLSTTSPHRQRPRPNHWAGPIHTQHTATRTTRSAGGRMTLNRLNRAFKWRVQDRIEPVVTDTDQIRYPGVFREFGHHFRLQKGL